MKTRNARVERSKTATRARTDVRIESPSEFRRLDLVDAARGVAIAMMIAYHFCFDLTYFGWTRWAMLDDPGWVAWRTLIVTSFLLLVGLSLALRDARDQADRGTTSKHRDATLAFARRWAQIAGAAVLVTAGSALLFPEAFIYFGVLHFVAVALVICRRAPRLGAWAIALGAAAIALGLSVHHPAFDPRFINWIGFAAHKPITEDYVPLFPWLGVVLVGSGLGALWVRRHCRAAPLLSKAWQAAPAGLRTLLAVAGRWSLTIYLVHQPILIGAMSLLKQAA